MMMERIVRLSSDSRQIVLDPFMGSGTTAIACLLSDREFIGFEEDKKFFNYAKERCNAFDIINYPGYNYSTDVKITSNIGNLTTKQKSHIKNNIPEKILKQQHNERFF